MDPTLLFRIQRRARRGRAGPQPVEPILLDIHNGFCAYVASILCKALGPAYSGAPASKDSKSPVQQPQVAAATTPTPAPMPNVRLVHLHPPERLMTTGCWCPNPSKPRQHHWRTCGCFIPQHIVAPEAVVEPCPHQPCPPAFSYNPAEPPARTTVAHLFCFDPLAASASYMRWFLAIQGPPDTPPSEEDATYLGRWLTDCYYSDDHYRGYGVPNPYLPVQDRDTGRPLYDARWDEVPATDELAHAHFRLVSRLFIELRGDPPEASRAGCWYDAERVHSMIRWDRMRVQETMDVFLPFVLQAKGERLMQAAAPAPARR
ncbi:hypothetical protein ISF_02011 [Cordyceps fumosorosea ARSEF 2679]|uniref:Uncharacterized protein n=1 Tax=Cordyceps fumosorosea (strain ARSEF 2679) TaxID=1081104 RepID=A0A168CJN5_CORFA|nr:hypothetical protein ISF_02011 [Cordyceps fumosorosea ARSEF 2679]OAA71460.1 hypothetical protein ISF_02011 [Cordyceps fumosorosea ARSEF 2679]